MHILFAKDHSLLRKIYNNVRIRVTIIEFMDKKPYISFNFDINYPGEKRGYTAINIHINSSILQDLHEMTSGHNDNMM